MYHSNEKMHPNGDECISCLCTENFDNSTSFSENPNCKRFYCWPQLKYLHYLRRGCAPVFGTNGRCCAYRQFKCRKFHQIPSIIFDASKKLLFPLIANENDTIDSESISNEPAIGATCKFGNLTLLQRERLKSTNKNITCKCSIPPMITCTDSSGRFV